MVTIVLYDEHRQEAGMLSHMIRRQLAQSCDEESCFLICPSPDRVREKLAEKNLIDLTCVDLESEGGIGMAMDIREKYPETQMMLLASPEMSPLYYMRPGIHASSLLLKPVDSADAPRIIREFIGSFFDRRMETIPGQILRIEKRGEIVSVPCRKICYVEARMKKVFIRLPDEEYSCRDTLEKILKVLPDTFIRCHRGYIVNTERILKINFPAGELVLDNGMKIPLSRSCRQMVKEHVR